MKKTIVAAALAVCAIPSMADENLFGYVRGVEVLPKGEFEAYQWITQRSDKGRGTSVSGNYRAIDTKTELEYGVTDRFQVSAELMGMALNTTGNLIDGYLPGDKKFGWRPAGIEFGAKYNFLSPAKDDFGLSGIVNFEYAWIDGHSGQDKKQYEVETSLQAQKYFMEGQMVWVGNVALKAAHERRAAIAGLPDGFDWPAHPEMEITARFGTGLSYRFLPGWSVGVEALHETEYETEVGVERRSLFAGPTVHWAGKKWWATLTAFKQIHGGGEKYDGQVDTNLHLIEKTKNELRLKVGYEF